MKVQKKKKNLKPAQGNFRGILASTVLTYRDSQIQVIATVKKANMYVYILWL